jgi:outer membrane cobalamin receptor
MVNCFHRNLSAKIWNTVVLILFSFSVKSQISNELDTIRISEVIIKSKRVPAEIGVYKNISIDSSVVSNFSHETLAELLVQNSSISIKSYGVGGSATPSFRGTGASHTQLQWNSIAINNPMLGQPDLSLIPAGLIDEIDIYYGGSSMPSGTGGIGGIINLETKPLWRKNTTLSLNPGIGSFGQYSGLIKVRTGNLNFQSVTKTYIQYAENNFSYLNNVSSAEPVWEVRKNNQTAQKGFLQELYYRKAKNLLSARLWYQVADRNLPSSMLIQQPDENEKQLDESVRTIINYDGYQGAAEYFLTGSFSFSKLDYSNKLASIDSHNLSEMFILKAGLINMIGRYIRTKVTVDNENTLVKSVNYDDNRDRRNVASLTASAEVNGSGRLGASLLLREIIHGSTLLIPDCSTGLQLQIAGTREYYLKVNYSRNSKLPSMNDLFWSPGGNQSLTNESANMFEFIYEMNQKLSSPILMKFDVSLYLNTIKNMIQWRPSEYSYWVADNLKSVSTSGLESAISFNYNLDKVSSALIVSYTYTRATTTDSDILNDESLGKQLIYVPENQANTTLKFRYLNFYTSWIAVLTGRRYTTADNSSSLPSYAINSLSAGYSFNHRDNLYNASLTVDNILNVNYETIAYFPQAGRSFTLKLLIQFVK